MANQDLETVIGLEVHVELSTDSKAFCRCSTMFGAEPNTQICPVCLGLPGGLPVLNKKVLEYAILTGLALNCKISPLCKFDRKNYFYPDMPNAFQISQADKPVARNGYIDVAVQGKKRRIRINRVHMEEDAGKLMHSGDDIVAASTSLVDLNRAGVPLIEIVSEPDLRSPEEARLYLSKLKTILEYIGVSDCKMEEGSLRCDANLSIRSRDSEALGIKTELKNMNSFRAVFRGLSFEEKRQQQVILAGKTILPETRHWDEARGLTVGMRTKEEADDYRYFPEPNLPPISIDRGWVEELRDSLPEMPDTKIERYTVDYDLPIYDAEVLTSSLAVATFFEECVQLFPDAKAVSNWIMSEVLRLLNVEGKEIQDTPLLPSYVAKTLQLIKDGTISGRIAKEVFEEAFHKGEDPEIIVKTRGLIQISDESELNQLVAQVVKDHPNAVEDYRQGKDKALGFLVGQIMKATRGKANPQLVNKLIKEKL